MIELTGVNKSFRDVQVLKDINLTIQDNEVFGLVGPSGVGKSTLLNCLIGLETYQSGSISIDGVRLEELNDLKMRQFRKNMGMIFQNFSLVGRKDVFHNIALPMECWKYSKAEIKERVEELAELTGIQDKLKSRPSELSGGQKQRVAIARALTMNPKYLLCDECTSALDPKSTSAILDLLKDLQKHFGITIVVVTHEMSVVQNLCNRMAILDAGQVSLVGGVQEIFKNKPEQLKALIGEDDRKVSVTMDVQDFAKFQEYLDKNGTNYRISGGV
ncbi:MAG: ATP-binding cassette domain-containing protein [Ruminococcus sp.]|nr:ATP-binding cassette domain-containing protein [Ruminococcus sp.]